MYRVSRLDLARDYDYLPSRSLGLSTTHGDNMVRQHRYLYIHVLEAVEW